MVRHVILWKIKDSFDDKKKAEIKADAKAGLEALKGRVPGLLEMQIHIDGLASSSADLMMESAFEDEAALKGYAVHPEHVKVADSAVRPFMEVRMCLDFEV